MCYVTHSICTMRAGFVGKEVCAAAVKQGYSVTSLSRRGTKPTPPGLDGSSSTLLDSVTWVGGDATSYDVVRPLVEEADCVVRSKTFQAQHSTTQHNATPLPRRRHRYRATPRRYATPRRNHTTPLCHHTPRPYSWQVHAIGALFDSDSGLANLVGGCVGGW